MSSRNPQSRFSRARTVLVGLLAIILGALYGYHHRTELGQIFDELRAAVPFAAHVEAAQPGTWIESGPTRIHPQELARLGVGPMDRSHDDYERDEFRNS